MDRRRFLKLATGVSSVLATPQLFGRASRAWAQQREFDPRPGTWRTFEITTRVEVLRPAGGTKLWVPLPWSDFDYQQTVGPERTSGNAKGGGGYGELPSHVRLQYVTFSDGESTPLFETTTRVRTQSRAIDWARVQPVSAAEEEDARRWTWGTRSIPTDGIVKDTARRIIKDANTDIEKVKAIYDWTVASTYRETTVRGCGTGDVKTMLESKNLGGKCADINALFVGLVRSVGVPARDVYGIRVALSAFGYRSLGTASETVTKAQHCRAEVCLRDYGWVAMDPADVAKVAREETSGWLAIDDPLVRPVRAKLFGGWEGNWIAYNVGHDLRLPHATNRTPLPFFMYPQCETGGERRDSLDADNFKYTITARQVEA